jgi:release factor glutamine methyltransferase
MTLRQWFQKGEAVLACGPHPERAHRDAELLLLHAARLERAALLVRWEEGLDEPGAARYSAHLERRLAGEPMQYILGETEFYGLPFRVTPDVLIPRPETEHTVEKVLDFAARFPNPRIVDIGTGSGAIAVALAHKLPQAVFTAIDISAPALAVAAENAKRNGVAIRFLEGDLLAPVAGERFDLVVSNPPYVPESDRETISVEVRDHEPGVALFAGCDGMDVYRRLIPSAFAALAPGGFVAMEIGFGQAEAIGGMLAGSGFCEIEFIPDLQGIPRVACGQKPPQR